MSSLRDGVVNGLREAYCSNLRSQPEWWSNLRRVLTPTDLRVRGDALNEWVCGDGEDTFPPPPFEGGQCPVLYLVDLANVGSSFPATAQAFVTGPISGTRREGPNSFGAFSWLVEANPDTFFRTGGPDEDWVISGVSRFDSLPDDCGDPPPVLPPPGPIVTNIDVTYGDNNQFNLTVPTIFAPVFLSVNGTVNVPVSLELFPGLTFEGTLELFPDFDLDLNFPGSGDPDGTGPTDDPPPPPPDGDGETGDPDPETPSEDEPRVYGLLCRALIESEARPSGIFQEVGPDIYVPRLGSARFGTTIEGVTFWSEDIDIKGLNSVIQCPIPWGAARFVVNAAPGVVMNYTPISSVPKDWPPFLQLGRQFTSDNR